MALARRLFPALVGALFAAIPVSAQDAPGTITGRVVDAPTQQPLADVNIVIVGTTRGTISKGDGTFALVNVLPGPRTVRASRIGYGAQTQEVTVPSGGTVTAEFALTQVGVVLSEIVSVGYGTQRREAVTGSVATVDADVANVGVVPNVNSMIQGRVAGVNMVSNSGEPGSGAQIRIRGGTSISASNEPLYVIDGVPISNAQTEASGVGPTGQTASEDVALPRSPLNLLNPSDIESITILKDASATAIYGARGANGVILIETKRGLSGKPTITYDGYVASSQATKGLDVLNGDEYRTFIQGEVAAGRLPATRLATLGTENTDWAKAIERTAVTHNHNLSFAGGATNTQYRASLNYMNTEGVILENGLNRIQGRLNAAHQAFENKLRLGLNLTSSQVNNNYVSFENTAGFEGGIFTNVAYFNPTRPITVTDPGTGQTVYYEIGPGRQAVRNPVALAYQVQDRANTNRTLGNATAEYDLLPSLTAQFNLGADRSSGVRRTYFPKSSPAGAEWGGRARQVERDLTSVTLQTLLTFRQTFAEVHNFDIVGGYEYTDNKIEEFGAEGRNFLTDAFSFNNLGGGATLVNPFSSKTEDRLVSFLSRANYSLLDRYYLTGVLRRDGSSRFGAGNKWAVFPAISGAWRISGEEFMRGNTRVSDLRLRAGWGLQGNPAVPPYASLLLLETSNAARYVFGDVTVTGVAPSRNPNADLKWEQTAQTNVGLDYGFLDNRFTGTLEYYIKNTSDLLLTVAVPQPAAVDTVLRNIGKVRNQGVELSFDAQVLSRPRMSWLAGLVFAAERNKVVDLGGRSFIGTGRVSGQGQSGQLAQRIIPGEPLGTFYGPTFIGVDPADGKQLFRCATASATCIDGQTKSPGGSDYGIIGNANPDFTLGIHSNVNFGNLDFSFLINSAIGQDVFNNTALVYQTKSNALTDANFLRPALNDPTGLREPAIYSSRWIEDASFTRLQNVTVGYTFGLPGLGGEPRNTRVYFAGDNLFVITDYSGLDPEVHTQAGLASRGIDYLHYPRSRTFTGGVRVTF
jgi:TonB-linked SusC/RagA family outer membrane protein